MQFPGPWPRASPSRASLPALSNADGACRSEDERERCLPGRAGSDYLGIIYAGELFQYGEAGMVILLGESISVRGRRVIEVVTVVMVSE